MKLLLAGTNFKFVLLKEFGQALDKVGIESRVVIDSEVYDTFPSMNVGNWLGTKTKFNKLISELRPDAVLVDRGSHLALAAEEEKIPVFALVRGDFWAELEWWAQTKYNNPVGKIILWQWRKINDKCFQNCTAILPICKYLEDIVKTRYPNKRTEVLYGGIDVTRWSNAENRMDLKHPCVGLLQDPSIWGKTKEMLTLVNVMKALPDVTFYWAGDGMFRDRVLPELQKHANFKWLGSLKYPEEVRQYLSSIDVYALPSGIDMFPSSLQEAQLMERPVVATNVGGIPETMQDQKTGYLVEKGNSKGWIEKLSILLHDREKARQMGTEGRNFVKNNFDWSIIAKRFSSILESYLK